MIDIIIPAFNAHKTIKRTLKSIEAQKNLKDLKVYIINDASNKDYSNEINIFKSKVTIKEIKLENNVGPGSARQIGVDNSNSEYIVFIDADDVLSSPDSLTLLFNDAKQNDADVTISNFYEEDENGEYIEHNQDRIWLHGKLYRRAFLKDNNIRFNNTRANEDNGFNQLIFLSDSKISEINDYTYIWKYSKNSITRKNDKEYNFGGLEGYIYNMNWALEKAINNSCNKDKISALAYSTLIAIYFYYISFYDNPESIKLIHWAKSIYQIVQSFPVNDDYQKNEIMKLQYNYFTENDDNHFLLNQELTFNQFCQKILETESKSEVHDKINIAMISSKDWYYYLIIDIFALLNNTKNIGKIYLFVETTNPKEIPNLYQLINEYKDIEFILIDANKLVKENISENSPNINSFFTKFCLVKLLFTDIVKEDKLIFIDTDAIVKKDISMLWNYNIENYYLVGVKDFGIYKRGDENVSEILDTYINSGFLMYNLKKMRQDKIKNKLITLINNTYLQFPDQDALNLICKEQIKFIPSIYNLCEDVTLDVNNKSLVKVFHYGGIKEPWLANRLYAEEWYEEEEKYYNKYNVKKSNIKIDIIIPLYNAHNTIKRTLDSILEQNNINNLIIYLIDDYSKNTYEQEYNLYKDKMNITLYRLDKNRGPGYARQFGIDKSSSKYILFLDSDDVLYENNAVENMASCIEENNFEAVSGIIEENYFGEKAEYYVGFDTLHGKMYRRDFIKNNNITFPELYHSEDIAFNNQIIMQTNNIGQCSSKIYKYLRRKNSLTQTIDYSDKYVGYYCESLEWTLNKAIENNVNPSSIGRLLKSVFSYFYIFFKGNINNPLINNILKFLPYLEKYENYIDYSIENYWLDFWVIEVEQRNEVENYMKFINECINLYNQTLHK